MGQDVEWAYCQLEGLQIDRDLLQFTCWGILGPDTLSVHQVWLSEVAFCIVYNHIYAFTYSTDKIVSLYMRKFLVPYIIGQVPFSRGD